ncbi:MAG: hypothetical protein GY739_20165 [Mesoflavibacter sp.]|nr:hypothetical protein [Mesoflavibacter sp.]|tara:strand:- start:1560 stop:2168 length:609 start_codon:yes stop_codon:yes gene_type:complete
MAKSREIKLPTLTHQTAKEQATSFFDTSNDIANKIAAKKNSVDLYADKITYAVNSSFSAELYLKAIMIMGKGGRVMAEHDLFKIYSNFPAPLKSALQENYEKHMKAMPQQTYEITALTHSDGPPHKPSSDVVPPKFETFEDAIKSTSKMFVEARYFFEKMKSKEWNFSIYAPSPISAMLNSLDDLYVQYKRGDFKGRFKSGS